MRNLLVPRLPETTCVFRDVLEVWGQPSVVSDYLDNQSGYEDKVMSARALPRWTYGWCLAHNCWCPFRQSRLRVQGPPCVDWSPAGLGLGIEGPFFKTLLAAGSKCDLTSPCVCLVENVPQLPLSVLQDAYGPRFEWRSRTVCPADVGFSCVSRRRTPVHKHITLCIVVWRIDRTYFVGSDTSQVNFTGDLPTLLDEVHARLQRDVGVPMRSPNCND